MTDKGSLAIDLVCPEGHVAGQLIRNIEHQANEIQVPDRAREEWPRSGDRVYTLLFCRGCDRRLYGSTDAIQRGPVGRLRVSPSRSADTRCATSRTA